MIEIDREEPNQPEVRELLAASDAYSASLYPEEGRHPVDVAFLASPAVRFFVARAKGRAIGCAALVLGADGSGELKRMIVLPAARGRGAGHRLIERIESAAIAERLQVLRLETGPRNREAIALYRRHGFAERGPFGAYEAGPHSLFMEKRL